MTHLGWRAPPGPERRERPPTVEELHASARADTLVELGSLPLRRFNGR
jgi:hypothetical protein